jgi:hypothetical protein
MLHWMIENLIRFEEFLDGELRNRFSLLGGVIWPSGVMRKLRRQFILLLNDLWLLHKLNQIYSIACWSIRNIWCILQWLLATCLTIAYCAHEYSFCRIRSRSYFLLLILFVMLIIRFMIAFVPCILSRLAIHWSLNWSFVWVMASLTCRVYIIRTTCITRNDYTKLFLVNFIKFICTSFDFTIVSVVS